ncbi:MAG: Eco57I restriction-modification methylase domain-containing protein [Bacteroidales bacterium]|nr:Eco57I restriction-modification methylase domain-containing protein [Bacteroidales bacterium]
MSYNALKVKIIYVYRIEDNIHKNCVKIGEATYEGPRKVDLAPNSNVLQEAARKRIDGQVKTAGLKKNTILEHVEIAFSSTLNSFVSDTDVHEVLKRSKIKQANFDGAKEWFITDTETARKAISAAKQGRVALNSKEISKGKNTLLLREEQKLAVSKTINHYRKFADKSVRMLWYAKMRFGKTVSALQVVKEMDFKRTIIITHRPVVGENWIEEDFKLVFFEDKSKFECGSKNYHHSLLELEKLAKCGHNYVYFASVQDLRGSEIAGGKYDKNSDLFEINWDFVIVDEAHEGIKTEKGQNVLDLIVKQKTKQLYLSGTPFNMLDDYNEEETFSWDYTQEQEAKINWLSDHPNVRNPYEDLPKMSIYTFDLGELTSLYKDSDDNQFNFKEFFRVWRGNKFHDGKVIPKSLIGKFVHETEIKKFLDLICKKDSHSNYPFSTEEYREMFRHTLWKIPGVKEAAALEELLHQHPVFSSFNIANVAGNGGDYDEDECADALERVNKAITENPFETYSITLSCGRLTTGVTVRPWTAVFMLSGSYNTAAAAYMQTIFRVQSPWTFNGWRKEECFVFDFAPDRTLKVIAEVANASAKVGSTRDEDREKIKRFLSFCPVVSMKGTKEVLYTTDRLFEQLKKVAIDRAVNKGFEDNSIYNDRLWHLSDDAWKELEDLRGTIGSTQKNNRNNIVLSDSGLKDRKGTIGKKNKKIVAADEEKERLHRRREAIATLRGISIRMPLLIYGACIKDEDVELTIDNFTDLVDDESWYEFMPKGVTKETFLKYKGYYDNEVFNGAGKRIRSLTRSADLMDVNSRIKRIVEIFSRFRNPDKETVLTPWRVVNMHMSDTLGGYDFFDEYHEKVTNVPRYVTQGTLTESVFGDEETKILEINSKTGLYPLYVAYSIFREKCKRQMSKINDVLTVEEEQTIWDEVLLNNVFVVCKTAMAEAITRRTLGGFRENVKINARYIDGLIDKIEDKSSDLVEKICDGRKFWKTNYDSKMKFNAVVGNPPYQEKDGGAGVSAKPLYHHFVNLSKELNPQYLSIIMPARWYVGGKGLDDFRKEMLRDKKILKLYDYPNSKDLFSNVDIAGGLCYFLWQNKKGSSCVVTNIVDKQRVSIKRELNQYDVFVRDNRAIQIIQKVTCKEESTLDKLVSSRKPFGLVTNYEPKNSGVPCWFIQRIGKRYASLSDIIDDNKILNKWKLLAPKSPIAGQTDFTKPVGFYYDGNTVIAAPGECCTESFIVLGAFDTEKEVLNYKSYIFTKVVRFLLLQAVVSQDVTKKNFCFVPNLGKYNQIYSDKVLCKRWGITDEEMRYIESRICNIKGR